MKAALCSCDLAAVHSKHKVFHCKKVWTKDCPVASDTLLIYFSSCLSEYQLSSFVEKCLSLINLIFALLKSFLSSLLMFYSYISEMQLCDFL